MDEKVINKTQLNLDGSCHNDLGLTAVESFLSQLGFDLDHTTKYKEEIVTSCRLLLENTAKELNVPISKLKLDLRLSQLTNPDKINLSISFSAKEQTP